MRRINVIGSSGSGKTTLARAVATRCSLRHLELDAIFHQPDWTPQDKSIFRSEVSDFTKTDTWVIDGNYSAVRDIIWARVETVVFLDLPRWRVMSRLIPRTLRRIATQESLWNGNRERWQNLTTLDPNENLLIWSWSRHGLHRTRYEAALNDPTWSDIEFVRLRSVAQVRRFVAELRS